MVGFNPAVLWKAPELNPINHKARTVPLFNVISVHGRVFFFSWFGFMIAFWSWYVHFADSKMSTTIASH